MEGLSPDRPRRGPARSHPEQTDHLARYVADWVLFGNGVDDSGDVENVALDEADGDLKLREPRELPVLLNLSYSLQMLRRLPWYACDDLMPELPSVVRQASRDAFFTHTRLVAEFFWRPA